MFEYQKLDLGESGFRLVRLQKGGGKVIECELIHTTLNDNVIPYEAVSYTWGTLKREKYIYLTGGLLPVTSNLWQVLHDLRRPDSDRYLWVDGICINQDDDLERGHQVRQMKHIYMGADRGIFYLSPHVAITQVIMESLTLLQKQVAGSRWAPDDGRWDTAWHKVQATLRSKYDDLESRQREGLAYLLLSPFFKRVWILQEVASARRASVFCGTTSIPAQIFAICTRIEKATTNSHTSAVIGLMQKSLDSTTNSLQGKSLASLLKQFSESEASDERDRIYALLGLCGTKRNAKMIIPDYTLPIGDVVKHSLIHIYGPFIDSSESTSNTVDGLVNYLRRPASEIIHELLRSREYSRFEAAFDYMNGVEAPITIPYDLARELLQCIIDTPRLPEEALHNYFLWLDVPSFIVPHELVMWAIEIKWLTHTLGLICQREWEVVIDAQVSLLLETRDTKMLENLATPCEAKVVIRVSMKSLWIILLLAPDDDIKRLIPLLDGVDNFTQAALTYLLEATSNLAGSLRSARDAIILLWRFTSDTKSRHDSGTTSTISSGSLGSRRRLSLSSNQMAGEHEETAELAPSTLRHQLRGIRSRSLSI
ncbi:heterokaryon incompatibility protein-domain-containing protein [Xylaria cf. heliscus]|nr:heterokaryon incompatibility protein-domain-containing protein [Xylaria cf. heliscus]